MALIKVSQLPSATGLSMGSNDHLMIVQEGVNKKLLFSDLFKTIKSDLIVNPDLGTVDVIINGQSKPNLLRVNAASGKVGINVLDPDELLHCNGNLKLGGSSVNGGLLIVSDEEMIIPSTPLTLVSVNTSFFVTNIYAAVDSVSVQQIDLGTGIPLQMKIITFSKAAAGKENGMSYIIDGTFHGFTQVKMSKVGDSVTLLYINNGWALVGYNGASII